ncbi:TAF6L factor, partial [Atractosteus spatula]|nr:TAF6L factor [Atractosteus spatula]
MEWWESRSHVGNAGWIEPAAHWDPEGDPVRGGAECTRIKEMDPQERWGPLGPSDPRELPPPWSCGPPNQLDSHPRLRPLNWNEPARLSRAPAAQLIPRSRVRVAFRRRSPPLRPIAARDGRGCAGPEAGCSRAGEELSGSVFGLRLGDHRQSGGLKVCEEFFPPLALFQRVLKRGRGGGEGLAMGDREERRFAEVPRESVRLMAESAGLELSDDIAALLAEDVCYRLREATQTGSQFMRHAKRRKLTVEDFNRALRWSNVEAVCGYGAQDALPFRPLKEGELYFAEDREINLVELALATNIPKGCAETMVRVQVSYLDGKGNLEPQGTAQLQTSVWFLLPPAVPTAVQNLSDDLLKYYQQTTRAILGEDQHLMKVALLDLQSNSKIAALLPYFVYVISGVKSVSHDLEQLNRLLHMVKSLVQNPFLYLGSYVRSLVSSVMYCILEPLAASINPLNDHWTLRDYAALLLSHIFWTHGDLVSGLYHQILLSLQKVLSDPVRPLCSHYGAVVGLHALGWKAVERVLYPHLPAYWSNLQAVLDDYSVSNAQVKADGHKVYGAILVGGQRPAVSKQLLPRSRNPPPPAQAHEKIR